MALHLINGEFLQGRWCRRRRPSHLSCLYCGREAEEWDHLIPISRMEGLTEYVAPSCRECNWIAGDTLHDTIGDRIADVQAIIAQKYPSMILPVHPDYILDFELRNEPWLSVKKKYPRFLRDMSLVGLRNPRIVIPKGT